jgi:hypothetical protein
LDASAAFPNTSFDSLNETTQPLGGDQPESRDIPRGIQEKEGSVPLPLINLMDKLRCTQSARMIEKHQHTLRPLVELSDENKNLRRKIENVELRLHETGKHLQTKINAIQVVNTILEKTLGKTRHKRMERVVRETMKPKLVWKR